MVEISPFIHQIDGVNANSYLVFDSDDKMILIDTGMSSNGKKILDYIASLGREPSSVKTMVLTHCHIDHTRGAFELKKATGAKLAVHQDDEKYVSGEESQPVPKGLIGVLFRIFAPFFRSKPVKPDILLKEPDRVGKSLLVIHTPGHTPGSIAIYDEDRKVIFVGDTLRYTKGRLVGPPKQFTWDLRNAESSIRKIAEFDFKIMLSGHGEPLKTNASDEVRKMLSGSDSRRKE